MHGTTSLGAPSNGSKKAYKRKYDNYKARESKIKLVITNLKRIV